MTDSASQRTVFDPFLNKDVQVSDRLVDRLRGRYACGPTLPNGEPEFGWREFQTPPIQHEAAARITELEATVARIKTQRDIALIDMEKFMNIATDCCDVIGLPRENFAILPSELSRVEGVMIERCAAIALDNRQHSNQLNYRDDSNGYAEMAYEQACNDVAESIRSLPPLAKRGDQKSRERSNPPAEQSTTLPQPLTEN